MEKYTIPVTAPINQNPNSNPIKRSQWKRNLIELNGKPVRSYRHDVLPLLMRSYSQIGAFEHKYFIDHVDHRSPCFTHSTHFYPIPPGVLTNRVYESLMAFRLDGVAAVEFDAKGIYLVSGTRSGCLTVHEFESLYCESVKSGRGEDEEKKLMHISLKGSCISSVRWNPANQDEVACTFMNKNEVSIFDIGYESSEPTEVLSTRPTVCVHGSSARKGLHDIALFDDNARVLASDTFGTISLWDRRAGYFPQTGLTTNAHIGLTSIQLNGDQCVYGASKSGYVHIWDLRGGRSSAAFQSHQEVHSSPLTSIKLASLLNNIGPLKAQSHILPNEIHSININPFCPYQLGFHLDDGWSGVLDLQKFQVSHIHCPPPPWLDDATGNPLLPRKPSWLPEHSIYAVGSTSSHELHLLDFYPNTSSPCHVDYDDSKSLGETSQRKQNILVPLSEHVTACATHPLNGTIVAGTLNASLLMISQDHRSCKNEGVDDLELS
ncbi:putative WD40/YVTN repeat-like-containing domain-containing protein [Tanacetum coccineum]